MHRCVVANPLFFIPLPPTLGNEWCLALFKYVSEMWNLVWENSVSGSGKKCCGMLVVWVLCKGVRRIGVSKCERRSECTVRGVKEALRKGRRSCEWVQGRKPVQSALTRGSLYETKEAVFSFFFTSVFKSYQIVFEWTKASLPNFNWHHHHHCHN